MPKGVRIGGRQKGTPNKHTADVRACIALIAERNIKKLEGWLARVAEDDPARAADLLLRVLEYHVPRLGRTELTGQDGGGLVVNIVKYTDPAE